MSAPNLSVEDTKEAFDVAEMVGKALRRMRKHFNYTEAQAARELSLRVERYRYIEAGCEKNLKLGTMVRLLGFYGLEIVIVRTNVEESTS